MDVGDISITVNTLNITELYIYIGEGNGNPLQWSCLENPGDRGAWWAAVYGVAQSRGGDGWSPGFHLSWGDPAQGLCGPEPGPSQ